MIRFPMMNMLTPAFMWLAFERKDTTHVLLLAGENQAFKLRMTSYTLFRAVALPKTIVPRLGQA
jgi:hypothetical protein